jgi:hypothetical protein
MDRWTHAEKARECETISSSNENREIERERANEITSFEAHFRSLLSRIIIALIVVPIATKLLE